MLTSCRKHSGLLASLRLVMICFCYPLNVVLFRQVQFLSQEAFTFSANSSFAAVCSETATRRKRSHRKRRVLEDIRDDPQASLQLATRTTPHSHIPKHHDPDVSPQDDDSVLHGPRYLSRPKQIVRRAIKGATTGQATRFHRPTGLFGNQVSINNSADHAIDDERSQCHMHGQMEVSESLRSVPAIAYTRPRSSNIRISSAVEHSGSEE